jgi:threonine dehydrogenase-like Zn-dependent dehydrogenase
METAHTFDCIWLEDGEISLRRDLPPPTPPPGEALIKPRLAGICGTDLELVKGYYPYTGVPGHEFVGEVLSCPDDPAWEGQRVVGDINAPCQTCETCRGGRPTHCPTRTVLGIVNRQGVFGQAFTLPVANLHRVEPDLPDSAAVFAEPLAAALQILEQVKITPSHTVLLIGAGRLGHLIALVLRLTGCQLLVLERHTQARRLLGAHGITTLDEQDPTLRSGGGVDVVVEATGSPTGFSLARSLVRPRGTIVAKSTYHGQLELDYSAVVVDEITLVGSRCGPMAPALRLMTSGLVDPTPLIAAHYPLQQGPEALKAAGAPGMMKVLLEVN